MLRVSRTVCVLVVAAVMAACGNSDGSSTDQAQGADGAESVSVEDGIERASTADIRGLDAEPAAGEKTPVSAGNSQAAVDLTWNPVSASFESDLTAKLEPSLEDAVANRQLVEAEIAKCMRQQGFDYRPRVYSVIDVFDGAQTAEEFAQRYGFGFATTFRIDRHSGGGVEAEGEPLTEAATEQWWIAFDGSVPDEGSLGGGGCVAEASSTVNSDWESTVEPLRATFDALAARITADSRIVDADRMWAECIGASGYEARSLDHLRDEYSGRLEDFAADFNRRLVSLRGDAFVFELTPEEEAKLDRLKEDEIGAAMAAYECWEPLRLAYREAWADLHAQFIGSNSAELDRVTFPLPDD